MVGRQVDRYVDVEVIGYVRGSWIGALCIFSFGLLRVLIIGVRV